VAELSNGRAGQTHIAENICCLDLFKKFVIARKYHITPTGMAIFKKDRQ
jgi:hypothetical protein